MWTCRSSYQKMLFKSFNIKSDGSKHFSYAINHSNNTILAFCLADRQTLNTIYFGIYEFEGPLTVYKYNPNRTPAVVIITIISTYLDFSRKTNHAILNTPKYFVYIFLTVYSFLNVGHPPTILSPAATHNLFKNKTIQHYDAWHYLWGFFYLLLFYQNFYRKLFKVSWKKLFRIQNVYRGTKMANNKIGRRGWEFYCGTGCLCQTHYE